MPPVETTAGTRFPTLGTASKREGPNEKKAPINKAELYPRILRWIGASILGLSALCFLVSGWVDSTPLIRTGSFLGFTALLSVAGAFCAYRWHEDKGARTFLALACAFLPANFAQLGALIYAEVQGSTGYATGMRGVFTFEQVGSVPLMGMAIGCLIVLIPVAFTGFSALARTGAKKMTALFLAGNALLLLPWRDANLVAGLGAIGVGLLVFADRKWFSKESSLRTWDGVAMRSLIFVPIGLMLARNLVMHAITPGILAFITGSLALVFFSALPRCLPWPKGKIASQFAAYASGLAAWGCVLESISPWKIWGGAILPLIFLPWCLSVFALSFKSEGKGVTARGMAATVAFAMSWANLEWIGNGDFASSILCMLVAVGLLLAAFLLEERTVLVAGLASLLVGLAYHIQFALSLVQQNLWLSLALAGACTILASSYLERNGVGLRQRTLRLRRHWQGWQ